MPLGLADPVAGAVRDHGHQYRLAPVGAAEGEALALGATARRDGEIALDLGIDSPVRLPHRRGADGAVAVRQQTGQHRGAHHDRQEGQQPRDRAEVCLEIPQRVTVSLLLPHRHRPSVRSLFETPPGGRSGLAGSRARAARAKPLPLNRPGLERHGSLFSLPPPRLCRPDRQVIQ